MTTFPEFPADGHAFSAAEVGQALAGLVARDSAGLPKDGMMAMPTVAAVAAAWKVQIGRFVYARNIAGAVRFSGLSEAEQIDVTSSVTIPAGQSRIDRIGWNPVTSALVYIQGVASVTPTAPALGSNAPVMRFTVLAGDSSVVAGRVVIEAVYVGLIEKRRPVATSSLVHFLGVPSHSGFSLATGLAPVDYPRVLSVGNGDLGANPVRIELTNLILPANSTSATVAWTGAAVGSARMLFTATPVEP